MPYLNDDELASLHKVIDDAKDDKEKAEQYLEEAEQSLAQNEETLKKNEKTHKRQNIMLSILAGIGLALAFFFYNNGTSSSSGINIEKIKQLEATRVLDSISYSNQATDEESDDYNNNTDSDSYTSESDNNLSTSDAIASVKKNIKGEKIYSVQIGAFTRNRYSLLSETLAGISSTGDLFKYSIGLFKTLKEAQKFRKELLKIGFKDSFVASYVDGVRQEIEKPN